jgi:hypothetical protein
MIILLDVNSARQQEATQQGRSPRLLAIERNVRCLPFVAALAAVPPRSLFDQRVAINPNNRLSRLFELNNDFWMLLSFVCGDGCVIARMKSCGSVWQDPLEKYAGLELHKNQ